MITITTQGKTYQIVDLKGRIKSTIEEWISAGYLEEVKENKEPQFYVGDIDISTGKPFKSGSTTQTFSTIKDQTILEKLREELDKMKTENTDTSDEYTQGVLNTCGYLLDLLTSLEQPKEQPQPQEDIELLPKFDEYLSTTECIKLRVFSLEVQVELLTSTVNQLIKANK